MTTAKSAAAVTLGKARWRGRTKAERAKHAAMMRAAKRAKSLAKRAS